MRTRLLLAFVIIAMLRVTVAQAQGLNTNEVTSNNTKASEASLQFSDTSYRVALDTREARLTLGFYGQISQFSKTGESLLGYASEVVATYALRDNLAAQVAMSQALSMDGAVTILYTGLRSSIAYALSGSFTRVSSILEVNERPALAYRTADRPLIAIDGGVDQFFFNGVSRIVPATGISSGVRYDRTLFNLRASAMLRGGMLVIAEEQVPLMSAGMGLTFSF